jgi:hypothetical protein
MTIFGDDLPIYECDVDWLRAARLKKAADGGDKKAAAELKRMESTVMVPIMVPIKEEAT